MDDAAQRSGSLVVGVPRERVAGERRVALGPDAVADLVGLGLGVTVESGAGEGAFFDDEAYFIAGAQIAPTPRELYDRATIVARVQAPLVNEVPLSPTVAHTANLLRSALVSERIRHLVTYINPLC